jgi:hypothetical protein
MTSVRNLLYAGITALALSGTAIGVAAKTDCLDRRMTVELAGGRVLDINAYNPIKLRSAKCALRAREIAEQHFGKHYEAGAAWDRSSLDVVQARGDNLSLDKLVAGGVLQPGMLVGLYNPASVHSQGNDMQGNPREVNHIAVHLGKGKNGKQLLAHQYGPEILVTTEDGLRGLGYSVRYVFGSTSASR